MKYDVAKGQYVPVQANADQVNQAKVEELCLQNENCVGYYEQSFNGHHARFIATGLHPDVCSDREQNDRSIIRFHQKVPTWQTPAPTLQTTAPTWQIPAPTWQTQGNWETPAPTWQTPAPTWQTPAPTWQTQANWETRHGKNCHTIQPQGREVVMKVSNEDECKSKCLAWNANPKVDELQKCVSAVFLKHMPNNCYLKGFHAGQYGERISCIDNKNEDSYVLMDEVYRNFNDPDYYERK